MSESTRVQLPPEPCLVISDGEVVTIATDRSCESVRQWGLSVGPVARSVTAARLRSFADLIEPQIESSRRPEGNQPA